MNKEDVTLRVMKVISVEANIPVEEMEINSAITDDLDISSLELISMICGFEEEFDIEIQDDEFFRVITVEDIVNVVLTKVLK